jgi:hypothetical protein
MNAQLGTTKADWIERGPLYEAAFIRYCESICSDDGVIELAIAGGLTRPAWLTPQFLQAKYVDMTDKTELLYGITYVATIEFKIIE